MSVKHVNSWKTWASPMNPDLLKTSHSNSNIANSLLQSQSLVKVKKDRVSPKDGVSPKGSVSQKNE